MGHVFPQVDLHRFHKFSIDVSSLVVMTSAFVKKGKVKDETYKKFVKAMEVKLSKEQVIDLRFSTGMLP